MPSKHTLRTTLKKLGANIRRARTTRGMTQEKLAEKSEISTRALQKIEAGDMNFLVTTAVRIQKALGCSWGEMTE